MLSALRDFRLCNPFCGYSLCVFIGILVGVWWPEITLWASLFGIFIFLFAYVLCGPNALTSDINVGNLWAILSDICQHFSFIFLGLVAINAYQLNRQRDYFLNQKLPSEATYFVVLNTYAKKYNNRQVAEGSVVAVKYRQPNGKDTSISTQGKILVSIKDRAISMAPGCIISTTKRPNAAPQLTPKKGFNYKLWLATNNISGTLYLAEKNFRMVSEANCHSNLYLVEKLRNITEAKILSLFKDDKTASEVATLLVIGQTKQDSREGRKLYQEAGASHALAVSGLHILLLANSIGALLLLIGYPAGYRASRHTLVMVLILAYGMFAGLSASVVRAIAMYGVGAITDSAGRFSYGLNRLFVAITLSLIFAPLSFLDLGFIFSYGAVLGIVLFYQRLVALWPLKNNYLKKMWQAVSINLAASVFVMPYSVMLFGTFPIYGLLVNLLVVVLGDIALACGLAFSLLGSIPYVGAGLGWVFSWSILAFMAPVRFNDSIALHLIKGIDIAFVEVAIIIIIAIAILQFVEKKRFQILYMLVLLCFFYASTRIVKHTIQFYNNINHPYISSKQKVKRGYAYLYSIPENKA